MDQWHNLDPDLWSVQLWRCTMHDCMSVLRATPLGLPATYGRPCVITSLLYLSAKRKKKFSSSTAALARILPRMLLFLLHMQGSALVGCSCRRPATFEAGQEPHGATRPCRGHRRRHLLRCGGGSLQTRGCVLCQTPDLQVSFNILALNDGHHASAHAPRNTGRNMLFL